MKLPYSKFYWRDWQADAGLRACSLAARGLWVEMLAIMAQNDKRYGYLEIGGKMPSSGILARLIGATEDDVQSLMHELAQSEVPSFDGETWFSRRLVREGEIHDRNKKNGQKGGNPILKKEDTKEPYTTNHSHSHGPTPPLTPPVNPPVNPPLNPPDNRPTAARDFSINPPTIEEMKSAATTIAMRDDDIQACFDHYAAQGWLMKPGMPVRDLRAVMSKWKARASEFAPKQSQSTYKDIKVL